MNSSKTTTIIFGIFASIGLVFLIVGGIIGIQQYQFVSTAIPIQGKIISFDSHTDDKNGSLYSPIFAYDAPDGTKRTFTRSVYTSNAQLDYPVGTTITVLMDPQDPNKTEENTLTSLWSSTLISTGLGALFFSIGSLGLVRILTKRRRYELLKIDGHPVIGTVIKVIENTDISVKGQQPYQIIAKWQDLSGQEHRGKSQYFWSDPRPYLTDETITIYIDSNNPNYYLFDEQFIK